MISDDRMELEEESKYKVDHDHDPTYSLSSSVLHRSKSRQQTVP